MTLTTNLGLKKPDQEDFYNVDDFNYNADVIDVNISKDLRLTQFLKSASTNLFDAF